MRDRANIEYRAELIRKLIHFCSLSIPVFYTFLSRSTALNILIPLTTAFLVVDIARHYHTPTARLFYELFGVLLRPHELSDQTRPLEEASGRSLRREGHFVGKRLNGATNMLLSATFCVLIFPKIIVISSFAILIVSDSIAALVGRRWGQRKFFAKSLEGSFAFLLSAILVVFVTPKFSSSIGEYGIGATSALVGMLIEASALPLDDNITIPLGVGGAMWALYAVFYPTLNIYPEFLGF